MTTATRRRAKSETADDAAGNGEIAIPVRFKNVNIGDEIGSVGIAVDRQVMSLSDAEEYFCGHRLIGRAVRLQDGESPRQKRFDGDHHQIGGAFDVKKYSVSPKTIDATLSFALGEIDIAELGYLAKQSGQVLIERVEEIRHEDAPEEDDEETLFDGEDEEDEEPTAARKPQGKRHPADFEWRPVPVGQLGLSAALVKRLEKGFMPTIGALCDFIKSGQPLEAAVGAANQERVCGALVAWLREHNVDPSVIDPEA